jgi:hypothetical protein
LRVWPLSRDPSVPAEFKREPRYDQDEDTVVLSVDFAVDAQAKAFVKRFGDPNRD